MLGGTQSLHTNSYDEALALPTEEAVRIALRTQQIIAHETGVANTIDPLGGSLLRRGADRRARAPGLRRTSRRIDELGGMVEAVKQNFPQREIADAELRAADRDRRRPAHRRRRQRATPTGDDDQTADRCAIDPALERKQIDRVQARPRAPRRRARSRRRSRALREAAARDGDEPHAAPARRARARTPREGEIVDALQDVWGDYTETPVF